MESCANEGEEVQISVSKCFKCTCQVSCTYSWVWQLCGISLPLSLWGQFAVILVLYFIYKSVAGLSVQSAPALGCVPTEMTQYGRNKAKQFPCSSNKSCTVSPYPLSPSLWRCMSDASDVQPGHAQRMCGTERTDMLWMWPCVVHFRHFVHFTMPARRGQEMSICLVIPASPPPSLLPFALLEIFQIFALDSH